MVKVKNTAQFIERARQVHGDRYDYSQSVWLGASSPIAYKCNKCGKDTQTANAYKHINEKQKSGCGSCYKKKWDSKEVRQELKARLCACGKPLNSTDRKKVACSKECGYISQRKGKLVVMCVVCGKSSVVYPSKVRENNCCSLDCQREWALNRNRGGTGVHADWLGRSKKAKEKYKRECTLNRSKNSQLKLFFSIAKAGIVVDRANSCQWKKKCSTARNTLSARLILSKEEKQACGLTFEDIIKSFWSSLQYEKMGVWEKKCYSTVKNMKWRRRLRNARRVSLLNTGTTKAQPKQLTLWE